MTTPNSFNAALSSLKEKQYYLSPNKLSGFINNKLNDQLNLNPADEYEIKILVTYREKPYDSQPQDVNHHVKYLVTDLGKKAEDITLSCKSKRSVFLTQSAKQLHEDGYPINILVEDCTSSLSASPSAFLSRLPKSTQAIINSSKERNFKATNPLILLLLPLATSMIACGVMGLSIGLALSELIMSAGILIAAQIAKIRYDTRDECERLDIYSYYSAYESREIQIDPPLYTNLSTGFDYAASAIGVVVSAALLFVGLFVGCIIGTCLSLASCFTDEPINMPLDFALKTFLNLTIGDLNPKADLEDMAKKSGQTLTFFNKPSQYPPLLEHTDFVFSAKLETPSS
ncbi:MAG: hypothetical protein QNK11_00745 [Legionella sp.]|nr:hypothetical protein [Legionella sp.]